jgi:hypothetical protein
LLSIRADDWVYPWFFDGCDQNWYDEIVRDFFSGSSFFLAYLVVAGVGE